MDVSYCSLHIILPRDIRKRSRLRYDLGIMGGLVLDGLGSRPARSNVYVSGERVACVCSDAELAADETISAKGLVVAPGFIDTHSHSDLLLFSDPLAKSKIAQVDE